MSPQHAPHRHGVLLRELIEITTLTPTAGPDDVARNLRAVPHLGRETDRTSPRCPVSISPIGQTDAYSRNQCSQAAKGAPSSGRRVSVQPLDSETVLVCQVGHFH